MTAVDPIQLPESPLPRNPRTTRRDVLRKALSVTAGAGALYIAGEALAARPAAAAAAWQSFWKFCGQCKGMVYTGGATYTGVCPNPNYYTHNTSGSYNYWIRYRTDQPPTSNQQQYWAWCSLCQGMFFYGFTPDNQRGGHCPSGGAHGWSRSYNYMMSMVNTGQDQREWRYCLLCTGFFYGGSAGTSCCPAKDGRGPHDGTGSFDYWADPHGF